LMLNRPEWVASFFGAALAGAIPVGLSTFSTPVELEALIKASDISVLLFEGSVLAKDFAAILRGLEPEIASAPSGNLASQKFPFLRRIVQLDADDRASPGGGVIEGWQSFLASGQEADPRLVDARSA